MLDGLIRKLDQLTEEYGANFVDDYYSDLKQGWIPTEEDIKDYTSAYNAFKHLLFDFEYGESAFALTHNHVIGAVSKTAGRSSSNNMNYLLKLTGWSNDIKRAYRDAVRDREVWMCLRYA